MAAHEVHAADWDVFVSYSRSDAQRVAALIPALESVGLRVFVDDTAVDDFASITATIAEALSRCRVLLAVYSADYPQRRACQWELTFAYLTGQAEGDPRRRILVINPEAKADHVQPVELRDTRHWPWPADEKAMGRFAERVATHAGRVTTPMGDVARTPSVPWLPAPVRPASVAFTGRLAEQWRVHTALQRHRAPLVAQAAAVRVAQLRGMPGIGKSLLAQEYALHFGSAYPGGVFWFDLHRSAAALDPSETMDAYAEQVATVVAALELTVTTASLAGLLSHLAVAMGERDEPCLWVVDGVPDGLSDEQLRLLHGPHLLSATLITTRSMRYTSFAEPVDVSPLHDSDAYRLLTHRQPPQGDAERAAAIALVHDLNGHTQALHLLAGLAVHSGFVQLRDQLHTPGFDVLDRRRSSAGATPSACSPALDLMAHPLRGDLPTDDVLRVLAVASPAPLKQTTVENVLSTVSPYAPWEVTLLVGEAIEKLLGIGLLQPVAAPERSWAIHPMLARGVRRHDTHYARQEDLRRMLLQAFASTDPAPRPGPVAPGLAQHTHVERQRAAAGGAAGNSAAGNSVAGNSVAGNGAAPPGTVERAAAFDLQVELVTRVGVQPLADEQGSLREALTSLHSLFATARDVLHRMSGETAGPLVLPGIAASLVNRHLRPFLATWHPALQEHEAARPFDVSPIAHERRWARSAELRDALAELQVPLTAAAQRLAALCGVDLSGEGDDG